MQSWSSCIFKGTARTTHIIGRPPRLKLEVPLQARSQGLFKVTDKTRHTLELIILHKRSYRLKVLGEGREVYDQRPWQQTPSHCFRSLSTHQRVLEHFLCQNPFGQGSPIKKEVGQTDFYPIWTVPFGNLFWKTVNRKTVQALMDLTGSRSRRGGNGEAMCPSLSS